jgi:acetyl esterase/lipase
MDRNHLADLFRQRRAGATHHRASPAFLLTVTAVILGCSDTVDITPVPGPPKPALLEAASDDSQIVSAGAAAAQPPVVVVQDTAGRGVADVTVKFTVASGAGTVTPSSVTSDAEGRAALTSWIVGTAAGENTVLATSGDVPGIAVEFVATVIAGPVSPSRSTLSADPATVPLDSASTIRLQATDAYGNPITDADVHLSADDPAATLEQPPATTEDGTAAGTVRFTTPGDKIVSATVGGVALDHSVTVSVVGPPEVVSVTVSPDQPSTLVGQSVTLTATARDEQGDPIPDAPITWSTADPGVATVDADGLVTGQGAGTAVITAMSGDRSGTAQLTVSLGAGTLTGLTYCTIGGVADKMDVHIPSASKPRPMPVAVYIHGGGWVSGNRTTGFLLAETTQELLDRGYLVASLDYRLAPAHKWPAQIQDVKCAIRHLRANASHYGLDPDRIGVWGGSAGGQLVSLLGTAGAGAGFDDVGAFQGVSSAVQAVAPQSAITDFTHTDELRDDYSREFPTWPDPTSPELIGASPVTYVTPDDSPFFFMVGEEDDLVLPAQSQRMDQLLRNAGVESSVLVVKHAGHAYEPIGGPIDPDASEIITRIADFFDSHLR